MKKYVCGWFYGIYGIELISHGAWSDPELKWHGKSFNYYDVETPLYNDYKEACDFHQTQPTEEGFKKYVKRNAWLVREYLQNLLDSKCFYGGK